MKGLELCEPTLFTDRYVNYGTRIMNMENRIV